MQMKRIISLALVILMLLLCGCTKPHDAQAVIEPADYEVGFVTDEYDEKGCHVTLSYPVVSGLSNDDELNAMLKNYVKSRYAAECLVSEDGKTAFSYTVINAAVTFKMKGFFSALIFVEHHADSASHEMREGYSINCATDEGKIYSSAEIIGDFDGIRRQFVSGAFVEQYGMTNLTTVVPEESLMEQYSEKYEIFPQIYFENGTFGMNIDVVHLYGGYAGFATDIENVSKYLNKEITFVAALCGE